MVTLSGMFRFGNLVLATRKMLSTVSRQSKVFGRRCASSLAQKYSNALYSATLKKSPQQLSKIQNELAAISNVIKSNEDVAAFIANPTLSSQDRSSGLQAIFAAAGRKEQISDLTKNLFGVLSENGRLGETKGVIEGFEELVAKHKGELEVIVTSAQPLPADVQRRLETTLKQSQAAQQAKTVKVTNKASLLCKLHTYAYLFGPGKPNCPWRSRCGLWR